MCSRRCFFVSPAQVRTGVDHGFDDTRVAAYKLYVQNLINGKQRRAQLAELEEFRVKRAAALKKEHEKQEKAAQKKGCCGRKPSECLHLTSLRLPAD